MKLIVLVSVIVALNFDHVKGDVDCSTVSLTETSKLDDCCKVPDLVDGKALTAVFNAQMKTYEKQPLMMICTSIEKYFVSQNLAKGDSVDVDAASKFISTQTNVSASWKPILTENVKVCVDEVTKQKGAIVDALKKSTDNAMQLDADKCNISFLAFSLCSVAVDFSKCPKDAWTDNAKCQKQKDLFTTCGLKIDFWKNMFANEMKEAKAAGAI